MRQRSRRTHPLCLYLCVPILLLAVLPAWGNPGRGVYVNGYIHKISINSSGYITIEMQVASTLANGIFTPDPTKTKTSQYKVCRTYNQAPGEGLAVFGNKIFYAYTADTSCSNAGQGMSAYVATFDLTTQQWISNRAVGPVHVDNIGKGSGSGAAITVLNNQLYLFTDNGTYLSGDGIAWSYTAKPLVATFNWEPLDAVTIFPPKEPPRALIVYGFQPAPGNTYSELWAATWDGESGEPDLGMEFVFDDAPILGRVSLLPGTASIGYSDWGAKEPAVQLFANVKISSTTSAVGAIRHLEYVYTNFQAMSPGTWREDPVLYPSSGTSVADFWMFPTSSLSCEFLENQTLVGVLWANWRDGSVAKYFAAVSDRLVPQNKDIPMTACGDSGGTGTDTGAGDPGDPDSLAIRQHYWSLVGVVLGSPPFNDNGLPEETPIDFGAIGDLSNVSYAQSLDNSIETSSEMSNEMMFSAGLEVRAGNADKTHVTNSFDAGYKHAWESAHSKTSTTTMEFTKTMGTNDSALNALGMWGWAIFSVPVMVVQNWDVYAYDYDLEFGTGTPLNQSLQTIEQKGGPGAAYIKQVKFDLANPGGPRDDYPGLLAGMAPFSTSQDLNYWYRSIPYNWQQDGRWKTQYGNGTTGDLKVNPLTYTGGSGSDQMAEVKNEAMSSSGHTDEVELTHGKEIGVGTKFAGVKVNLTSGYEGVFKSNTTTKTGVGTKVTSGLHMKSCVVYITGFSISSNIVTFTAQNKFKAGEVVTISGMSQGTYLNGQVFTVLATGLSTLQFQVSFTHADVGPTVDNTGMATPENCTTILTVQPYWLQALDPTAPWVPTAYQSQLPWALTWKVTEVVPNPVSGVAMGRAGTALAPLNAAGRIVSGNGGGEGGEPYSHYFIEGGRLASVDANGTETRIPMTADEFVPSKGVSFEVQGLSWSSVGEKGSWTRSGDVWTFQPDGSVKQNRVTLILDFAQATFDLQIQRADLNGRVLAGVTHAQLVLTVNQLHTFYTALQHDIDIAWRWSQPPADANTLHVISFQGRYNSATGSGKMSMSGTLPAQLPAFGDVSLEVNGHPYVAPLINLDGFQRALQSGGVLKYEKQGFILVVDFGKKTWSATFNEKAFDALLAPRWGKIRSQVMVGGTPWLKAEDAVVDFSANLKLSH